MTDCRFACSIESNWTHELLPAEKDDNIEDEEEYVEDYDETTTLINENSPNEQGADDTWEVLVRRSWE